MYVSYTGGWEAREHVRCKLRRDSCGRSANGRQLHRAGQRQPWAVETLVLPRGRGRVVVLPIWCAMRARGGAEVPG